MLSPELIGESIRKIGETFERSIVENCLVEQSAQIVRSLKLVATRDKKSLEKALDRFVQSFDAEKCDALTLEKGIRSAKPFIGQHEPIVWIIFARLHTMRTPLKAATS